MTVVIGFNWPVEHDHSVAVVVDGELVFASEEERWTRHKHSIDEPPINALVQALKFLKSKYGLSPSDVDAYAVNYEPRLYRRVDRAYWLRHVIINGVKYGYYDGGELGLAIDYLRSRVNLDNYLKYAYYLIRYSIRKAGFDAPINIKVIPVEHHLAHAASAYYFSGFGNAVVLTVDAYGEIDSTVIWRVKNGEFEKLLAIPAYYGSLGALWDYVSQNLNFRSSFLEGPGKVMGLAPYGSLDKDVYGRFLDVFDLDNKDYPYILRDRFKMNNYGGDVHSGVANQHMRIADFITGGIIDWDPRGELDKRAVNIAYALQKFTDDVMLRLAEWARSHVNEQYLALAGGVALNAKANMAIHYSKLFSDMFIFPAANDAGTTVGAAAYVYEHVLGGKMKNSRLRTVYLGPEYSDDEVKRVVERSRFEAHYIGDDVNEVADLVSKGFIVAWYQGRAELGPRALGNRSIVADPRRTDMWKAVNSIKGREWWRPLAPSLLVEDMGKYFIDPVPHQFMILMFRFRDGMREVVPAVYHVDGTARPQTVAKDENPTWYELIKAFKDLTGEGIVLNTSFNLAGEPLVETPQDAIKSFAIGGLDAIYIQGWLIRKR